MNNAKAGQTFLIIMGLMAWSVLISGQQARAYAVEDLVGLADNIRNDSPGIELTLWSDKDEYKVGETVHFGFSSDKACYLILLDIGTSGKMTLLFPNKWHTHNKIEPGKEYAIPPEGGAFAYTVGGPMGTERIKALASLQPFAQGVESLQEQLRRPLEQSSTSGGTFLVLKNADMVLKDIGISLSKVDPTKWATVELKFKVSGGSAKP